MKLQLPSLNPALLAGAIQFVQRWTPGLGEADAAEQARAILANAGLWLAQGSAAEALVLRAA